MKAVFFSLMMQNLIKNSILGFCFTAHMQGGLWKKQLITSFVKQSTESETNAICIGFQVEHQVKRGIFSVLESKIRLRGVYVCIQYDYYTQLSTSRSTKKPTDSFFRRAL